MIVKVIIRVRLKYAYSDEEYVIKSYSSDNGKKGLSIVRFQDYGDELTDKEFRLLVLIVLSTPVSHDPISSGVIWLYYKDWEKRSFSRQFFNESIKRFVDIGVLEFTGEKKWYIISTRDVNSYYKVKIKHNEKKQNEGI